MTGALRAVLAALLVRRRPETLVEVIDRSGHSIRLPEDLVTPLALADSSPSARPPNAGPWWVLDPDGIRFAMDLALETGDTEEALVLFYAHTAVDDDDPDAEWHRED